MATANTDGEAAQMGKLLEVDHISLSFGGIAALSDISASVNEGSITAIIGPNGAGKTSFFNVISGFYRPSAGAVRFDGIDILAQPAHTRSSLGIARTFQNIALFEGMTVLENIKLGAHAQLKSNVFSSGIYLGWARREEESLTDRIDAEVVEFLELGEIRDREIAGLPYGMQKRVELARALVMRPRLLLVDEPFAGMNTSEKISMAEYLRRCITEWGTTALLIDHDMEMVMGLSNHVAVLNFGKLIAAGDPDAVRGHPAVIEAYLGAE
jgi:branched-chain amino acid transport system ATP-binding protein